jgi:hypothetical protein
MKGWGGFTLFLYEESSFGEISESRSVLEAEYN